MKDSLIKWFTAFNAYLIRVSHGKIGTKLGTQSILLLHHVGRKSGKGYVTPIAYFSLDGFYFVVASNWGKDFNAAWFHNLSAFPRALIEVKGTTIPVETSEAQGDEYNRLWNFAVEHHPPYLDYQKMTKRHIPIVIFKPANGN
jgi:deazaflavin-dependent oxidoreductase (nitroreductase family)